MGNFVLQDTDTPKLFVGTGTGFAPLYYQMSAMFDSDVLQYVPTLSHFVFGVRYEDDLFYQDTLSSWVDDHEDFSFQLCVSRPK